MVKQRLKALHPLKKQIIKFTLIGVLAVLTDMACYYLFLQVFPEHMVNAYSNEAIAKSLSFMCGMVVTYSLNKIWTWKQTNRSHTRLVKFAVLYGLSLLLNVFTNSVLLYLLHEYNSVINLPHKYLIAFIGATGVSALVNFAGQKFWVFRHEEVQAAE